MTYQSEVLADSPWGYWRCQETSGATLADASPNARPMTITGTPTFSQVGPDDKAILWPSGTHAGTAATVGTVAATLEAWVYLTALPTHLTGIIDLDTGFGGTTQDKTLYIDTTGAVRFYCFGNGSQGAVISPSSLTLNTWHHVVASVGAAGLKIRIDKTTAATIAGSTSSYSGAMKVWLHGASGTSGLNLTTSDPVTIAEPAFYTAQLTDARTDAHYDAASGGAAPPPVTFTGTWGIEF